MIKALILVSLLCAPVAFAQQPKDEFESPLVNTPSDLKQEPSFILKVDKDGSMSTLQTDKKVLTAEETAQIAATGKFVPVPKKNIATQDELETSKGTPAWIFCGFGFGYNYSPGFWNFGLNSWYVPQVYAPFPSYVAPYGYGYLPGYYTGWRGGWGGGWGGWRGGFGYGRGYGWRR